MTSKQFNKYFDHTNLKANADTSAITVLCEEAKKYGFASVAVNQGMVSLCKKLLEGSGVGITAVAGFPLGANSVECKLFEAKAAIDDGATEIDYVINVGKLKDRDFDYIKDEMQRIVALCKNEKVVSKVIFENCYLTDTEKESLCEIANQVKPDFIKTSTGFGPTSATVEDVTLMCKSTENDIKVKAAGGVRDLQTALKMIEIGAERIGCSNSTAIAEEFLKKQDGKN